MVIEGVSASAGVIKFDEPSTTDVVIKNMTENREGVSASAGVIENMTENIAESSSKKKKKKKKEKKVTSGPAAPALTPERTKNEDKKYSKHGKQKLVDMLAKRMEVEKRKKLEEEEKLRKEEEERLHQEELERQTEEKKRLKKEREKEKLLKKRLERKPLTPKQKEDARRLEAMRKQILANGAGGLQVSTGESAVSLAKRPVVYQNKKSKTQVQSAPADVDITDSKEVKQELLSEFEVDNIDKLETSDVVEDEDEEWDAKSWDDSDLKLPGKSAFADEEADPEPKPLVKELRNANQDDDLGQKVVANKILSEAEGTVNNIQKLPFYPDKNNEKAMLANEETAKLNDPQNLRSPICCIMGHVDTGKTKLLDYIRGTNVQEGEAGGITQQIGATYILAKNIRHITKELKADATLNVPGLLVIDTPGHESFTNLRSRGSGLCDIAILVVDIMHVLEPQTIESLNLLKLRGTDFIVALNKVDSLYGWKSCLHKPIKYTVKLQSKDVQTEFNTRVTHVITQFKEQGLNAELYYKNKEMGKTINILPTSAISGQSIPELLLLLVHWTQKTMIKRLAFSNEVQCTVLEVKVIEGLGTTVDVILVNGVLHEGDQIVGCGLQGTYIHHKVVKAAQGIKITAQGLEPAVAGTSLYVVGPGDDMEEMKKLAMEDMNSVMSRIDRSGFGVYVQASTLGSLEALLEFLKSVEIPVSGISIGPIHKKNVMRASVMLVKNKKEYGTILGFDVEVTPEARELAKEVGVKVIVADIIYHLFDQFKAYINNIKEERKKDSADRAVYPCLLEIIPEYVLKRKGPIILGVRVKEGTAKIGTPLCVPQRDFIDIGRIGSIQVNGNPVDFAKKGREVSIEIIGTNSEERKKMVGRHFQVEDELVSRISKDSVDSLEEHYKEDLSKEMKDLLHKLKFIFMKYSVY